MEKHPLGPALRWARTTRGLSTGQLAGYVGLHRSAVCRHERTGQVSTEALRRYCLALRMSADELLGLDVRPWARTGDRIPGPWRDFAGS